MSYIRTLQNYKYDFSKLPIEIMESVKIILSNPISNTKIDLLDAITFNQIRQTQPTSDVIETLFDIYENENTLRDNNGFNSLREIDEATELFTSDTLKTPKGHYQNKIPKGYKVSVLMFDRAIYDYISAKSWLMDNDFELHYPNISQNKIKFVYNPSLQLDSRNIIKFSEHIDAEVYLP